MSTIGLKLRNIAVAVVDGRDEPVYGLSNGEEFHSEDHILSQLNPGEKITSLYSERQPCPRCAGRLGDSMSPDAGVTWSVPWGDPDTELGSLINEQSNADLRDMLRRAAGF
ncbi:nucleic acid/nucleotide deaminase domain-containing protein [Streptomyces sp. NPDC090493]|uniref:nucleic acid/nucleotide deaminase domain-containing protein n=1 Tax=Streptomyces sp. NPDC090493 TaxID=3365964 RepID=UPI003820913C